jgi:predicted DsbA family dithiol-disulfide isomerase
MRRPDGAKGKPMSSSPTLAPSVTIDVVSDVMCPWCYIGKRRLEAALADVRREMDVEVRWRPYQLDPTLPKQGKDRKQYLEDKFGGQAGAEQAYASVRAAGAEEATFPLPSIISRSRPTRSTHTG